MSDFYIRCIANTVFTAIEKGCKIEFQELSDLVDVDYQHICYAKDFFENGYSFHDFKSVFAKYLLLQSKLNELPVLAEFFTALPDLVKTINSVPTLPDNIKTQKRSYPKFEFVANATLSTIYSCLESDSLKLGVATFINAEIEFIQLLKQFYNKYSLDHALCKYIFEKWMIANLKDKKTTSIKLFLANVECITSSFVKASVLLRAGASKEQVYVFANIGSRDATAVRRSLGINKAIYDKYTDEQGDCLFTYIEETFQGQEEYIQESDLSGLLLKLCKALDDGLPQESISDITKLVAGSYNATFSLLLKLLEYNDKYASHYDVSGQRYIFSYIVERIQEQYALKNRAFSDVEKIEAM